MAASRFSSSATSSAMAAILRCSSLSSLLFSSTARDASFTASPLSSSATLSASISSSRCSAARLDSASFFRRPSSRCTSFRSAASPSSRPFSYSSAVASAVSCLASAALRRLYFSTCCSRPSSYSRMLPTPIRRLKAANTRCSSRAMLASTSPSSASLPASSSCAAATSGCMSRSRASMSFSSSSLRFSCAAVALRSASTKLCDSVSRPICASSARMCSSAALLSISASRRTISSLRPRAASASFSANRPASANCLPCPPVMLPPLWMTVPSTVTSFILAPAALSAAPNLRRCASASVSHTTTLPTAYCSARVMSSSNCSTSTSRRAEPPSCLSCSLSGLTRTVSSGMKVATPRRCSRMYSTHLSATSSLSTTMASACLPSAMVAGRLYFFCAGFTRSMRRPRTALSKCLCSLSIIVCCRCCRLVSREREAASSSWPTSPLSSSSSLPRCERACPLFASCSALFFLLSSSRLLNSLTCCSSCAAFLPSSRLSSSSFRRRSVSSRLRSSSRSTASFCRLMLVSSVRLRSLSSLTAVLSRFLRSAYSLRSPSASLISRLRPSCASSSSFTRAISSRMRVRSSSSFLTSLRCASLFLRNSSSSFSSRAMRLSRCFTSSFTRMCSGRFFSSLRLRSVSFFSASLSCRFLPASSAILSLT